MVNASMQPMIQFPTANCQVAHQQDASTILQVQTKQWLATHAKRLPLPPLSPKVLAFVREWYYLVDTDGSGELSLDEVAAAMKVSLLAEAFLADWILSKCAAQFADDDINHVPACAGCMWHKRMDVSLTCRSLAFLTRRRRWKNCSTWLI